MKTTGFFKGLLLVTFFFSAISGIGQDPPADQLTSTWTKDFNGRAITVTLTPDHKFQTDFAGDQELDVWGSYVVSDNRITFTDEGGPYSSNSSGEYEFKVNDSSLTLTVKNDALEGRRMLMQGTWNRAPDDGK